MMYKVLNKHHGAKYGVYIGRPSVWGNPFTIGKDGDRATVIQQYEAWLRNQHGLLRDLDSLRGKDLICYCAPLACHGDLLLRLANGDRAYRVAWYRQGATSPR